ncbi:DJ-1/PfpI family protein [Elizabethkingia sp. HX XZB]|uniref:DJ-1/PfpI family protein n=1 Tax=Elizabethkingia TaxID=308865 RepID=UPI002A24E735|nr:DJ-1/PfpI family protein [Elizabethkingia sp. HX XZB]MDX8569739.1 DJ-1/PfpI family protein [Elizabethkingia sp. HX XZB]
MKQVQNAEMLNIAFLVYDQVEMLDLNGPLDVFVKANVIRPGSYNNYTVGKARDAVCAEANTMTIIPVYDIYTCPEPDMIVVPGANPEQIMKLLQNEEFQGTALQWVKDQFRKGTEIFTICTGSMLLSNTGILANYDITTHSMLLDTLEQYNPESNVKRGVRYVDQGKLITTAGITAGIDAALYVIGKHYGQEIVETIVELFEYQQKR